ncbi:hypothetical protein [Azospirillum sp. TSA6c]|uniref:hypothetical protein n=1 Tax=unclassified Azospirillum TaxID=2630922 RepID=UPI000D61C32A|nr:hypothetical protein [Azospirillum sp. TSA6c]PWC47809.1 hypothetical protein TSA6c_14910 [Azospirillum sp. TSA6c]
MSDEAQSAGGLIVAAVQLAIATGSRGGGAIFGVSGLTGVFTMMAGAVLLLIAVLTILLGVRTRTVETA